MTAPAPDRVYVVTCPVGPAADVVSAFEALGVTKDAGGLLVARSRCEAVMLKLSAAL